MTDLERFVAVMEYQPVDQVPNYEQLPWPQAVQRWKTEGMPDGVSTTDWYLGNEHFGISRRVYASFDWYAKEPMFGMFPPFEEEILERTERYVLFRDREGMIRRAMETGTVDGYRPSMDAYIDFPVKTAEDFQAIKKRYDPTTPERFPPHWNEELVPQWKNRQAPLMMLNVPGFYWRAREWMGVERLSCAWHDTPSLMHQMMEFWADFLIETCRPLFRETTLEMLDFAEDLSMRNGPLLSPNTYRDFIQGPLKRVIAFAKSHGVRWVSIDTDGDPELVIPLMMDAGVDVTWPMERTGNVDPIRWRKKFGRSLRMSGAVSKRVLAQGPQAIEAHLREMMPLIEEGGFIPQIDHDCPPDVSWDNFRYYMDAKRKLLEGNL